MQAESLASLFGLVHRVLHVNTDGITHEESLRKPEPGGNSMNWILGHLVATRNGALRLLEAEPVWSDTEAAPYQRGAAGDVADPIRFERILSDLDRSQDRLLAAISDLTAERLATQVKDGTLGDRLAFLHFHESYHAGQLGLLRRLLGKEGAIR
ncbi:MAG: DinB family protein [Candidatus Eisenbacteria bacterium]